MFQDHSFYWAKDSLQSLGIKTPYLSSMLSLTGIRSLAFINPSCCGHPVIYSLEALLLMCCLRWFIIPLSSHQLILREPSHWDTSQWKPQYTYASTHMFGWCWPQLEPTRSNLPVSLHAWQWILLRSVDTLNLIPFLCPLAVRIFFFLLPTSPGLFFSFFHGF